MKERCENCRFSRYANVPKYLEKPDDNALQCRRRAPAPVQNWGCTGRDAAWPIVQGDDWCAEYEPRIQRPAEGGDQ